MQYIRKFEVFAQNYSLRTLIYLGKTMVLWEKKHDTMEKTMVQ